VPSGVGVRLSSSLLGFFKQGLGEDMASVDDECKDFIGVVLPERDIDVKLPRKDNGNNGWDLSSVEHVVLHPGERALVNTGLVCNFPENIYGLIWPRSGLAVKNGIDVMAGLIDSSYRGEIKVALINHSNETVELPAGSKIAQMIIQREVEVEFDFVNGIDVTTRGEKGFGSSGL
jgi:dUTP pyrophosphatase